MGEARFTPGPWHVYQGWVHPNFFNPSPQGTNGDTAICEPLGPDKASNAHLMAAAPEMYEALKELVDLRDTMDHVEVGCYCTDSGDGLVKCAWCKATASIAKAERKT